MSCCEIEICVDNLEGAVNAHACNVNRVELCSNLNEGGITPSYGFLKLTRQLVKEVKLMVLIRPRGADFHYTAQELQVMEEDIKACAALGMDGVVFGCLNRDGSVDVESTRRLLELSQSLGLDVTFHRAFDMSNDCSQALEDLVSLGIKRVLTSGGQPSAVQGIEVLRQLVQQAAGRISIMAGGGLRADNVCNVVRETGVQAVHSSARRLQGSGMEYRPIEMTLCGPSAIPGDFAWYIADKGEIARIVKELKSLPQIIKLSCIGT